MTSKISAPGPRQSKRKNGEAPKSPKLGFTRQLARGNAHPDDWAAFMKLPRPRGVSTADMLGLLVRKAVNGDTAPIALPPSAQQKLEGAMRQARRELEHGFETRVSAEVRKRVETLVVAQNRRRTEYDRVIRARKGCMTKADYRLLERCLHPDNTASPEMRSAAFRLLHSLKLVLLNEANAPTARAA